MSKNKPEASDALIAVTKDFVTFRLQPRGAGRYALATTIHADADAAANAGLLTVAFVRADGVREDNPLGWSVSTALGVPFRYLGAVRRGASRYELPLAVPEGVAEVVVGIRAWMGAAGLRIAPVELLPAAEILPLPVAPPAPPKPAAKAPARAAPASVPAPAAAGDAVILTIPDGAAASAGHSFPVEPGYRYAVRAVLPADAPAEKAFLLRFAFAGPGLASGLAPGVRPQGLSFSERHGPFAYLGAGETLVRFLAPEGADRLTVEAIPWGRRSGTVALARELTLLKVADAVLARHVDAALERVLAAARRSDAFVLIYTGTKRIGEGGRANRSMMFARELQALGVPTVYTYAPSEGDAAPAEDDGGLMQLPLPFFDRVATRLAAEVPSARRILVGSLPDERYCRFAGLFRHQGWRVVYECRDDWAEFAAVGAARWHADIFERFAVEQAEKVFCVSPALVAGMRRFASDPDKVFLSPNGTTDHFIAAGAPVRRRRARGRAPEGPPVVGYFGHLTEQWFDWGALVAAARRLPGIRFEVIGFDMPRLSLPDNLAYLGAMTHDQILATAPRWSVGLIPFRHGKLSRAADPIKIYEYLALGLKVVSVPMGTIDTFPLTFCYEEFGLVPAIEAALAFRPAAADWRAVERLLAGASWRARLLDMLARSGLELAPPALAAAE